MNKQNNNFQVKRFLLQTVDPLHVGTGGNRLGPVDNSIVREPGTRLPKVPGTALHGAVRQYAAYRYGKPGCAGQGQTTQRRSGHCGKPTCPICYTFGAITGERSFSGVVSISDARVLLFPVYSMVGPVWVTSPTALLDAGFGYHTVTSDKGRWGGNGSELSTHKPLNLGWLMVEREGNLPNISWHDGNNIPEQVKKRVVLVSDKLFSQVVNSNLEIRTSVSINPETGAAEDKALFTYEAIPRATILWFDVVVDDFRGNFPSKQHLKQWQEIFGSSDDAKKKELLNKWHLWVEKGKSGNLSDAIKAAQNWIENEKFEENGTEKWRWERMRCKNNSYNVFCIIQAGLEWAAHLGMGGMGTRGFGRIKQVACFNPSGENSVQYSADSNTTTPAAEE